MLLTQEFFTPNLFFLLRFFAFLTLLLMGLSVNDLLKVTKKKEDLFKILLKCAVFQMVI